MRRVFLILLAGVASLGFSACTEKPEERSAEFFIFGTLLEVTIRGPHGFDAEEVFSHLHAQFREMHRDWHAWEPGLLVEINRGFASGEPVTGSMDIVEMTRLSQVMEVKTGGRFNPAIGALIELWGFHTSDYPVNGPPPAGQLIEDLIRRHPSTLDIVIDGLTMRSSNPAVQLDFGGIAKGYAIDIACETLREYGVANAIVNAGGDLRVLGSHGDRPWRIAVRAPGGGIIGSLESAPDEAIFTSGNYERFRQDNEIRYPHILDPRTGWPVDDVASATVITGQGWLADASATALIVAGPGEWGEVARSLDLDMVLLVDESGKAYMTPKMAERIELEAGIEWEVVER